MKTNNMAGETTNKENARCSTHYYQCLLALEELTEETIKPFMHNADLLRNFINLMDVKNQQVEEYLKSEPFRERANSANKMINALGFDHVQN